MRASFGIFLLPWALSLAAACSSAEVCRQLPPAFELDVAIGSGIDPAAVKSLVVSLEVGPDRFRQSFDLTKTPSGGRTSLVVRVDPQPASAFTALLTVEARSAAAGEGEMLGRTQNGFKASPDACNRFEMTIAGAASDGGPSDAGTTDSGPTDDGNGPADNGNGPTDNGSTDNGSTDNGSTDNGSTDNGPTDTGPTDTSPSDTGPTDTGPQDAGTPFPYTPSNFMPTQITSIGGPAALSCGATIFDSTALVFTNWCGTPPPVTTFMQPNGPEVVVLSMTSLLVASGSSLQLTGGRPVILAVFGSASVQGTIDASAHSNVAPPIPGPGGSNPQACPNGAESAQTTGGGGGGSFGGAGENGGDGADGNPGAAAGQTAGRDLLIPLRGGCAGGNGGGTVSATRVHRGEGGGAIQISTAGDLLVSGTIVAGGGGGLGGSRRQGGGGAGSGGGVLLEAVSMVAGQNAQIAANGGGGGEGGPEARNETAIDGHDGAAQIALGGTGGTTSGGAGGNGAIAATPATAGADGNRGTAGGGGGGGGLGRIRFNAQTACVLQGNVSPPATSNGAIGCP